MIIKILTLFPEMFDGILTNSIIKRALAKHIVEIKIINIRDYTEDKYGRVDSAPVGGGAGLIMKCQPILDCLKDNKGEGARTFLMSPRGKTYNQQKAHEIVNNYKEIILICGSPDPTSSKCARPIVLSLLLPQKQMNKRSFWSHTA